MASPATPQFWHISYPGEPDKNGLVSFWEDMARDEPEARAKARMHSRGRHATVTNREGLVATYVDGVEHHFN